MFSVSPYLVFDGNGEEAIRFYHSILGGKLDVMRLGEAPDMGELPPGAEKRLMHASLLLDNGLRIMASDEMMGAEYKGMHGFSVAVTYQSADEGRRIFGSLSEGGRIIMDTQKTFWAEAFGMFVDRYGTPWMINAGPAQMSS